MAVALPAKAAPIAVRAHRKEAVGGVEPNRLSLYNYLKMLTRAIGRGKEWKATHGSLFTFQGARMSPYGF